MAASYSRVSLFMRDFGVHGEWGWGGGTQDLVMCLDTRLAFNRYCNFVFYLSFNRYFISR